MTYSTRGSDLFRILDGMVALRFATAMAVLLVDRRSGRSLLPASHGVRGLRDHALVP